MKENVRKPILTLPLFLSACQGKRAEPLQPAAQTEEARVLQQLTEQADGRAAAESAGAQALLTEEAQAIQLLTEQAADQAAGETAEAQAGGATTAPTTTPAPGQPTAIPRSSQPTATSQYVQPTQAAASQPTATSAPPQPTATPVPTATSPPTATPTPQLTTTSGYVELYDYEASSQGVDLDNSGGPDEMAYAGQSISPIVGLPLLCLGLLLWLLPFGVWRYASKRSAPSGKAQ